MCDRFVSFLSTLAALSGLTFVVASMLGTGLSLTVAQIVQPLKNVRLVILALLALLANFVLVPLLAFGIARLLPLDEALQIGLIVLATTAGAPFLVKEVQAAQGNLSLGVGLMFLLMVVTIFYVPIVLPFLLPGVEVNAWDNAKSLIVTMLLPIVLGLLCCYGVITAIAPSSSNRADQANGGLAYSRPGACSRLFACTRQFGYTRTQVVSMGSRSEN